MKFSLYWSRARKWRKPPLEKRGVAPYCSASRERMLIAHLKEKVAYDEGRLKNLYVLLCSYHMLQSPSGRWHAPCKRETKVLVRSNRTWSSIFFLGKCYICRCRITASTPLFQSGGEGSTPSTCSRVVRKN